MFWRPSRRGRFRRLLIPLASTLLFSILTACKPPEDRAISRGDPSLRVTAALSGAPALGAAPLTVSITNESGEPVTGAAVKVVGDMTHAGMIPVLVDATETAGGTYEANDFHFTMAGDWIITITATTPGGKRAAGELFVTVPGR